MTYSTNAGPQSPTDPYGSRDARAVEAAPHAAARPAGQHLRTAPAALAQLIAIGLGVLSVFLCFSIAGGVAWIPSRAQLPILVLIVLIIGLASWAAGFWIRQSLVNQTTDAMREIGRVSVALQTAIQDSDTGAGHEKLLQQQSRVATQLEDILLHLENVLAAMPPVDPAAAERHRELIRALNRMPVALQTALQCGLSSPDPEPPTGQAAGT